jgi:hypothetical protein
LLLLAAVLFAPPARALDLFTLWQRPELPFSLRSGDWADYRVVRLAEGRRTEEAVRIQCLGRAGDGPAADWIFELLPVAKKEDDGALEPLAGEGLKLRFAPEIAERSAPLVDLVVTVVEWRDGVATELPPAQWRDEPLIATSLEHDFNPGPATDQGYTVRIVQERELRCRQLYWAEVDSQRAALPAGELIQSTEREVTAAVHADVPLLGIVFAAERSRAESRLEPPSRRLPPPPPEVQVQTLELVGFGSGAVAQLPERPR